MRFRAVFRMIFTSHLGDIIIMQTMNPMHDKVDYIIHSRYCQIDIPMQNQSKSVDYLVYMSSLLNYIVTFCIMSSSLVPLK